MPRYCDRKDISLGESFFIGLTGSCAFLLVSETIVGYQKSGLHLIFNLFAPIWAAEDYKPSEGVSLLAILRRLEPGTMETVDQLKNIFPSLNNEETLRSIDFICEIRIR